MWGFLILFSSIHVAKITFRWTIAIDELTMHEDIGFCVFVENVDRFSRSVPSMWQS